ncbi:MAG: S9 family peptidase [Candidatus Marinimicrobia bacterium]|nr:S9 family peptidase [Candidatus Neomarinimicrobiota bacterium]
MIEAPVAKKIEKKLIVHNDTRIDPYYWLRDRENPEVIDYLEAENAYTETKMKDSERLQKKLYKEMIARIKQDDSSVPYRMNGFLYYTRYEKGKEYPIYCRKTDENAEEEILLNVNELAEGYAYYRVSGLFVSPNNEMIAFGEDTLSRRKYTLRFLDLKTGKFLKDRIVNTPGGVAWANDNKTIFYNTKDETLRPSKTFRHVLGAPVEDDELVYDETENTFYHGVYRSKSGKYIMLVSESTLTTEYQFINADTPTAKPVPIQKRIRGLEYHPVDVGNVFYIRTNDNARNFKLVAVPISAPGRKNWKDIVPHREDVLLENTEFFKDRYVLQERSNALPRLRIVSYNGKIDNYIQFDEEVYYVQININREFDAQELRYVYESMTTPRSTYDYNMISGKQILKKQREVLGKFDSDDYETKRLWAEARDGVRIPLSVVYKKGTSLNGSAPLILYAYGSYGMNMTPYFSSVRLSLLNRGYIYVIAHIRGGQEMGRYWYEDGKLLKKKNTFTDFIDCADYLVKQNYTRYDNMVAMGGSAGGLLMGAVVNRAPEKFAGIVAQAPFVDVVTTMLDDSIPLTTNEYDEWGNPNIKEYYDYILSYSPYDNVAAMDYPNVLITSGLHDSQVQYWEPAKWTAKLRDMKTDDNLLLLKTEMDYGHGGASGRFQVYKEIAFEFAFIMKITNN